ncbi:MAG: FMN-binding protein [Sphaerochaeta sp.]|jgi:electron transport complex protein RnfG|nr:FMN-binding protein [Sphaerochaeta sp.]
MTKNARYTLILFSICAVCALVLAVANSIFSPIIARHQQEATQAALSPLAGGYTVGAYTTVEGNETVSGEYLLTDGKNTIGYILSLNGQGYGGAFTMLASYRTSGEIIAAKMMTNNETPGVGKKSEEDWYMTKFVGTGTTSKPVPTSKSSLSKEDSDAVSGASVTFRGVSTTLAKGAAYVQAKGSTT